MKKIILLNKKEGETPLEALENFRKKNSEYLKVPMTYAGRLDPIASGILLILAGEETKNKEEYLAQDKEYNFQVLFGFNTDTYDILGKVVSSKNIVLSKKELENKIKNNIKTFIGKSIQEYPIYSSKTVKGKPLFTYARSGEEVEIPKREIIIKKLELEKISKIDNKKLLKNIEKRIKRVKGDFRQKEILKIWTKELHLLNKQLFYVANLKIKCSSGTYVRNIANSIGVNIGIPALAFSIRRIKIGKYTL